MSSVDCAWTEREEAIQALETQEHARSSVVTGTVSTLIAQGDVAAAIAVLTEYDAELKTGGIKIRS